jgi:hypothetical protein
MGGGLGVTPFAAARNDRHFSALRPIRIIE